VRKLSFFGVVHDAEVLIAAIETPCDAFLFLAVEVEFDVVADAFVYAEGGEVFGEVQGGLQLGRHLYLLLAFAAKHLIQLYLIMVAYHIWYTAERASLK
jgi:hypothetical protein